MAQSQAARDRGQWTFVFCQTTRGTYGANAFLVSIRPNHQFPRRWGFGVRKFVRSSRAPSLRRFSRISPLFLFFRSSPSSQSHLHTNITAFSSIIATPQAVHPSPCSFHRVTPELYSFIHHPCSMVSVNGFPASGLYGAITAHVQHRSIVSITENLLLDTVHSSHPYHDLQVPARTAHKHRREQGSFALPPSPHRPPPWRFPWTRS